MTLDFIIGIGVAVFLAGYLLAALLLPERF